MSIHENAELFDKKEPSPKELKNELLKLYELIPSSLGFKSSQGMPNEELEEYRKLVEEKLPDLGKRHRSEYKKSLVRKFGELLKYAKPHTTRYFRQHLASAFDLYCELGADKQDLECEDLFLLLGLDFTDKNSIFDLSLVHILETRAYKNAHEDFLTFNGGAKTEEANKLHAWKNAYAARYKKELSLTT